MNKKLSSGLNNMVNRTAVYKLYAHLFKFKLQLLIALIALTIVSFSLLSLGTLARKLIDSGLASGDIDLINHDITIIFYYICIFIIGSFFRSFYINLIADNIASSIKLEVYSNFLNLNLTKFELLKPAEMLSGLSADIETIKNLIINSLSFLVRNAIMLVGGIIMMILSSPKLAGIILATTPVAVILLIYLSRKMRSMSKKALDGSSEIISAIEESLLGVRTIFAFNQKDTFISNFAKQINSYNALSKDRLKFRSLFFASSIFMISAIILLVIWAGVQDIAKGAITSGEVIAFVFYAMLSGFSAGGIAEVITQIYVPLEALDRLYKLFEEKAPFSKHSQAMNTEDNLNPEKNVTSITSIKFANIRFAYPLNPDNLIFTNLNLSIDKPGFYGLTGPSGFGKSTIMQLLIKFYPPLEGDIFINNIHINEIDEVYLRSLITYAEQEPTIFSGSIFENIKLSSPDSSDEQVIKVAKICGVIEFADKFPDKIHSKISFGGKNLSGGQKQRINLARCLLKKPLILLLDEATSALDTESEKKIMSNILNFMQGKIVISIAHRKSSLINANYIYDLGQ